MIAGKMMLNRRAALHWNGVLNKECIIIGIDGSHLFSMVPSGYRWFLAVINGSQLFSIVPSCSRWFPAVIDGS